MRPRTSAGWMILLALGIATGPAWRATPALAAQSTVAPRASDRHAPAEVPCTQLRSAMHGVMLIGARLPIVGGPAATSCVSTRIGFNAATRSSRAVGAPTPASLAASGTSPSAPCGSARHATSS